MSKKASDLREDARLRALRLICANPRVTQRTLAEDLGISLGATHYMLRALADRGMVKLERFSTATDKRGYVYVLTPKGFAEKAAIAARFLVRKRAEYDALRCEIESLSAELHASAGSESLPQ